MKSSVPRLLLRWAPFIVMAGLGFCAVAVEIDPGGAFPDRPAGPGLTLDEGFNAEEGVRLVAGLKAWASGAATWKDVFGEREQLGPNAPLGYHLADHPPGGRLWLGLWHEAAAAAFEPADSPPRIVAAYARLGSAAAFALLMLLVGVMGARWYGLFAGLVSAGSLLLMPRVLGHAHLASLETVMNLTYAAAIFAAATWWKERSSEEPRTPPKLSRAAFAGFVWGLALLTKIQAVLIGPPVVLWAVWHWRAKASGPLLVWGVVGLAVFFVGWPWLWFDPIGHALEYFRSASDRAALYVWYMGQRFADTQAPWHYPFVMFLVTMPVGLLFWGLCGFAGHGSEQRSLKGDGRLQLIFAATVFPLILFAIPGVAVYDGVRLFLVSSPLWAVAVGRGTVFTWDWLLERMGRKVAALAVGVMLCSPLYGLWSVRPLYLNYYNWLIGGLSGAEHAGMETNYWGDSLTRDFWRDVVETVPRGSTVHVTPVVHPLQLAFMKSQLPMLHEQDITLKPCIPGEMEEVTYLVKFHRKADLVPPIEDALQHRTPRIQVERQGVPLAAFYHLDR